MTDRFNQPPVALRRLPTQPYAASAAARPSRNIDDDKLSRPQP